MVASRVALLAGGRFAYADVVRSMGPVGYWRLGEASGVTAVDEMNANDGTYVNTPTLGVAGLLAGDSDTAATFTKTSSEYVALPTTTGFPSGATARSIGFVVKQNTAANQGIIFYGTLAATQLCYLYISSGGALETYDGASSASLTGAGVLNTGVAVHVVAVYDGTGWTIYVNNFANTKVNRTLNTVIGGVAASIAWEGSTLYLNGTLDEVFIVARALTDPEVARLYAVYAVGPG